MTYPKFLGVGVNDEDFDTCSVNYDATDTAGEFRVTVLWRSATLPQGLIEQFAARGIVAEADPDLPPGSVRFTTTKPIDRLIDLVEEVIDDANPDEVGWNNPLYWFQIGDNYTTLNMTTAEWDGGATLVAISEPTPDNPEPSDGALTPDGWRQYSERIQNEANREDNLLHGELEVREVQSDGLEVTIPVSTDILPFLMQLAQCHPRL